MPRIMTTAMQIALLQPNVRLALLSALIFGDNTIYVWTGLGPMLWNAMTFQGVGTLGSISEISEDSSVEAKNVVISLSGIPSDLIMEVLYEVRVLRTARVWLALFDAAGALIPTPLLSYQGKMDAPTINDDGKTCTCQINLENILVDLNRSVYRRYTAEDHQIDLADTLIKLGLPPNTIDTGFRFVSGLQEKSDFWGHAPHTVN